MKTSMKVQNPSKKANLEPIVHEMTFEELEKHLTQEMNDLNSVETFDFHSFDKVVRKRKRHLFDSEQEYQAYKKEILSSTQNGSCDLPTFLASNDKWNIIEGRIRLLAFKVLGINPVIALVT